MATISSLPTSDSLTAIQEYVWKAHQGRGFTSDPAKEFLMLAEEVGELAKALRKEAGMKFSKTTHRTETVEEVADVFIVLLALASVLQIDVHKAFLAKEIKNRERTWA